MLPEPANGSYTMSPGRVLLVSMAAKSSTGLVVGCERLALGLSELEHGGRVVAALPPSAPVAAAAASTGTVSPAVQDRLVAIVVVAVAEDHRVLHPDSYWTRVGPRRLEGLRGEGRFAAHDPVVGVARERAQSLIEMNELLGRQQLSPVTRPTGAEEVIG